MMMTAKTWLQNHLSNSAPPKKLDEQLNTFRVSVSTLGGATVDIVGINATTSVGELLDNIESALFENALCISCGSSTIVTAEGELLSRGQALMSLADAGIVAGSTLNVHVRVTKLYKFKHAGRRILIS